MKNQRVLPFGGLVGIPDVILLLKDIEDKLPLSAFNAQSSQFGLVRLPRFLSRAASSS